MTDKERLEEIQSRVWKDKGTYAMGDNKSREGYIYTLSDYDYEWLIEQADKVEQLQQENEKLNQVIDWMNEGCEYNNESHLKTYKQLQQAQAKAEYYEMKYENTGAIFNRRHMLDKIERYEKAIKECIERMNEGGAGTRSFVYEKLREVMEGTECMGK